MYVELWMKKNDLLTTIKQIWIGGKAVAYEVYNQYLRVMPAVQTFENPVSDGSAVKPLFWS